VPEGITGPTCSWGTLIYGPGPPSWDLDPRLTTLFCKTITVTKSKEVKTRCILAEISKEICLKKGYFDDDDNDENHVTF
jgi:hypothetical protein